MRRATPKEKNSGVQWRQVAVCIFLVAITWIVFGQTLRYDFVNYDDKGYVYGNTLVTAGITPAGLAQAFVDIQTGNWHPLTLVSHMLDVQLYGVRAGAHHFTNVLLHTISVILLFFLLRKMTDDSASSDNLWRCGFVAAIFAIHPLRVESVAWIAERKDVLSGMFFMLTLGAYLHYVRSRSASWYFAVVLLFACGLMSKPMLVTVPFVLLLLDFWPLARGRKLHDSDRALGGWLRLFIEKIPLIVLSAVSGAITFNLQEHSSGSIAQLPMGWRVENAVVSYFTYIWQIFWPVDLTAFYPHPEDHLRIWQVAGAAALLVAITVAAYVSRKKRPYLIVGWLWYLVMLVPVIGIVEVGLQGHADRYTYLPHIGLYVAMTWLVADFATSIRIRNGTLAACGTLIIIVLSACSWKQTSYWRNSETLWDHALAVTQNNDVAHTNLGILLMERGQLDDALTNFQTALQIREKSAQAAGSHYDLSQALIQGDIGNVLAQKGRLDEAIGHLRKAIEFQPDYADAHYNLGTALFQRGETDEAINEWQKTLAIRPNDSGAHSNLGNALVQKKRLVDAIQQYRLALQFAPQSVLPLNNLAWILSTCSDASLRNGVEAVALAEKANRYSENRNAVFIRTLAAAYAEAGRFEEAMKTAQQASETANAQHQRGLAIQIQEDADLYRRRIALRDDSLSNAH